jgi:WD40 repeat protein
MSEGVGVRDELRSWAVAHARTVGRSGLPATQVGTEKIIGDFVTLEAAPKKAVNSRSVAWSPHPTRPLLAVAVSGNAFQLWDPDTGRCLLTLDEHTNWVRSLAWSADPNRPLLATGSDDYTVRIWNDTGQALHTFTEHGGRVRAVAWSPDPKRPRLATGSDDQTVRIWDPQTGRRLHTLTGHTNWIRSVAWSTDPKGPLLASAGDDGVAKIWDPQTGRCLQTLAGHTSTIFSVAWSPHPQHPLVATASGDRTVRIWDPETGRRVHLLEGHADWVRAVVWSPDPLRPLLVTAANDGRIRIWNADTGSPLESLEIGGWIESVHWSPPPHHPRLAIGGDSGTRIFDVTVARDESEQPDSRILSTSSKLSDAVYGTLALGGNGLWVPLGLLADLVTLTGSVTRPGVHLNNPGLRQLSEHLGVVRLRSLDWPSAARIALAALLVSATPREETFTAPDGAVGELRDALTSALRTLPAATVVPIAPTLSNLESAADTITDKTSTLLMILGPQACAADPTLPLRLLHHAASLPELAARHAALLAADHDSDQGSKRSSAMSMSKAAGVSGIARHGTLHNALLTQIALPEPLPILRHAHGELLHHAHTAHDPPAASPLTLVLDTTPPTFGPCEAVLRLVAYLAAVATRRAGHQPTLITLTHPRHPRVLTDPSDLAALWTSRTLAPPDLVAALQAAATTSTHPVVVLTTSYTAHHHVVQGDLIPSSRMQLVTTSTATTVPAPPPGGPHHHLVAVDATAHRIKTLVHTLVTTAAQARADHGGRA